MGESATSGHLRDSNKKERTRESRTFYQSQDVIGNRHNLADDNWIREIADDLKTKFPIHMEDNCIDGMCSVASWHFATSLFHSVPLSSRVSSNPSLDVESRGQISADEIDDASNSLSTWLLVSDLPSFASRRDARRDAPTVKPRTLRNRHRAN